MIYLPNTKALTTNIEMNKRTAFEVLFEVNVNNNPSLANYSDILVMYSERLSFISVFYHRTVAFRQFTDRMS